MKSFLKSPIRTAILGMLLTASLMPTPVPAAAPTSVPEAMSRLQEVGPEARGHENAQQALRFLAGRTAAEIPQILAGMDGANPLAANWFRSAVESIAQREFAAAKPLPAAPLGEFLLDVRHSPAARQLAYELLAKSPGSGVGALVAGMLNDPSMELRRAAVQQVMDQAALAQSATNNPAPATLLFQQALVHARDVDQIESIVASLKKLGHPTQLARLFGWIQPWKVIGPFDNTQRGGFDTVYPPEKEIQLSAEYDGKGGKVRWQDLKGADDYGKIDVNVPLGKLKETIAYCYTELNVDRAQPVELRLGCKNAWKVWLNGKLLFGRDEYHRGAEIDQYRLPAELKAGKNTVLVKLGQNEQKEDWTIEWEFQLRVTDALGTPIAPLRAGVPQPTTASR